MVCRYPGRVFIKIIYVNRLKVTAFVLISAMILVAIINIYIPVIDYKTRLEYWQDAGGDEIFRRVIYLFQVFDPRAWIHAIHDQQNFGFLGILRLEQLRTLKDLMREDFLIGVGFIKILTDFHGFYFTLLGASGILGSLLFLFFGWNVLRKLANTVFLSRNTKKMALCALVFCAVSIWFLSSVTQSMYIHFSVWIHILMAMYLINDSECVVRA